MSRFHKPQKRKKTPKHFREADQEVYLLQQRIQVAAQTSNMVASTRKIQTKKKKKKSQLKTTQTQTIKPKRAYHLRIKEGTESGYIIYLKPH